ncbi:MAG: adenosine deaminase [Pseudomonadales bacterium]|jgi:adenosine deaminase
MSPEALALTEQDVARLPKVELHVHLEGSISPQRVVALAAARGEALKRPVNQLFRASSLDEFLANLDWVCSLVRTEEEAEAIAMDFARYAEGQGIVYAEVIVNPSHWRGIPPESLLAALCAGFSDAHARGGPDLRLVPSILRQQSVNEAIRLVDCMAALGSSRIVALSTDGNQARALDSSLRLAPAFEHARARGFAGTAHAGESSGPEGVLAALDVLRVQRIDHGVRAVEDRHLLDRLAREHVTLNVCLSSNCHLLYPDLEAHPLPALMSAGVRCTLNTDDPVVLGTTLNEELFWSAKAFGWDRATLATFQQNALRAAFCSNSDKSGINNLLDPL